MTPEQHIQFLMEQNAKLMEQNQQLIALASKGVAPEVPVPTSEKLTKKEKQHVEILNWYSDFARKYNPQLAAILKAQLKKAKVWLD